MPNTASTSASSTSTSSMVITASCILCVPVCLITLLAFVLSKLVVKTQKPPLNSPLSPPRPSLPRRTRLPPVRRRRPFVPIPCPSLTFTFGSSFSEEGFYSSSLSDDEDSDILFFTTLSSFRRNSSSSLKFVPTAITPYTPRHHSPGLFKHSVITHTHDQLDANKVVVPRDGGGVSLPTTPTNPLSFTFSRPSTPLGSPTIREEEGEEYEWEKDPSEGRADLLLLPEAVRRLFA